MADIQINKFGKGIDLSKVKGGLKKEEMKTEEQKSIFKALDKDNNGILDEKELKQAVDVTGDNKLSKKEARAFIKENGLDGLKKKDIMKFVESYINNTQDVADVKTAKNTNGETTVQVTYNDGTQETINADRSSELRTKGEDGSVTTQYKDANKNLVKDTVEQENGDTVETEYEKDGKTPQRQISTEKETGNNTVVDYENGKPAKEVATDNTNNTVSTTNYENGTPKTKTVEQGETTVSNYTITEDGKEVLDSKIENKGIEAKEKRTDYTYNEDGTVTANVKEPGRDTVQQLKDGKVQSEVIKEKDKTTTRTFAEDGSRTEVVTDDKGNTSTTNFNADGNKLSQTKTVNGKEYSVEYDGKGNTKVVLQNGESVDALARKFNTTKKAVLEANGGKVRGWAGDSIVVPGEIEADSKKLQGRDSAEEAKAKYRAFAAEVQRKKDEARAGLEARKDNKLTWTEKKHDTFEKLARGLFKGEGNAKPNKYELQMRIDELKKLNPNLKDGELIGKKVTVSVTKDVHDGVINRQIGRERQAQVAKAKTEAKTGKDLASAMYRGVDDHAGGVSSAEFKNALAKVNKDNVVGLLEQYNKLSPDETLIEAIMDETGNTMATRRNAESKIINALIARAKSSGISDDRAKQQLDDCVNELSSYWSMGIGYCQTEKLDGLVKNVIGAIHTAEAMTKTEKSITANDNAIDETLGIMSESLAENSAKLKQQLDQDGWCADLYEGLKWCVGSKNLDENVKADLRKFETSMKQLDQARKTGGEAAFKTKFKEIFGVTYDPNLAKSYRKLQSNLANAQALTVQLDGFNKEFANSINGKESYGAMLSKFGSYMQQTSDEVKNGKEVVEKSITLAMQKDGIEFANATDAQKAQYLRNIIKDTQSGISSKINEYTRGKDLATLEADLKQSSTAVFGNKGDIVNRVNSYVNSQQVGGAVVNGAVKAVGAIAIAVCTGGTGLVALTTVAAGTAALSAATDLSDRASSEVGLQDGEITNILKNAAIDGVTVFAGGKLTKAAMAFKSSKAFIQAGGRMLTQAAGDVAIGAAAEYGQTGEITLQGVTFQAVFSAAGNLVALKQLAKGTTAPKTNVPDGPTPPAGGGADAPQAPKAPKQNTLDVATSDGNKAPGGPLGDAKMEKVKVEVSEELPSATPERGAQIHQEADQLQAQSRTQGRDVKHMVEDEFGVVTIGKEHIDISTADAATLERLQKEVSGWSTDTRNRAEILKKLEARKAELQTAPETPKTTRSSEFVEKINANAQQNASDILAGKQGALPPHDAATLKEHLVNNLNTTEEIEGFMDALKKRVGVNDKGDMHVYQVQGVDQAADVMKAAEAKLAKVRAKQADVAATNSAADAAINGSRGLNNEEFATIKSFVDRTDSAEDLQALLKKFQENKNLRNSSASKKLVKTMQEKIDLLNAKAAAQTPATPATPAATQGTKPTETYVNSHEIRLDRAPEAAVPEGATIDFAEAQRRMPKTSETPAAPAAPKAPEVEVDPHHITLDEAPSAETPVVSKPAGSPAPAKNFDEAFANSQLAKTTGGDPNVITIDRLGGQKFDRISAELDELTANATPAQLDKLEERVKMFRSDPQRKAFMDKIEARRAELKNAPEVDAPAATTAADDVQVVKPEVDANNAFDEAFANSQLARTTGGDPNVITVDRLGGQKFDRISAELDELTANATPAQLDKLEERVKMFRSDPQRKAFMDKIEARRAELNKPATTAETPAATQADAPDAGSTPKVDAETPKVDAETPKVDAETPKVDAETPKVDAEAPKVDAETPKVTRESVKAEVDAIPDAQIPSAHRKLWADCKQRIEDITDKLSTSFSGNKAALVAKCKTLFTDLRTIAANATASVKAKIQSLMQKLRAMIDNSNIFTKKADNAPRKYSLTPSQKAKAQLNFEIFHPELQSPASIRAEYPNYAHLSDKDLLKMFKLDEGHAAFVKNRPDLFKNGEARYIERAYWNDSPYEHTNNHSAWKMHLFSGSGSDYQQMAEVILPYLNKNKIAHKTLSSTMSPELLARTAPNQAGKAFTIYPSSPQEMERISRDLDKLIRKHNLQTTNSSITGDNQLGNSGRLFYRYELPSGKMKDNIYKPGEYVPYEANRGEGKYLASDMTPADDPWLNFDPSNSNSKPRISNSEDVQVSADAPVRSTSNDVEILGVESAPVRPTSNDVGSAPKSAGVVNEAPIDFSNAAPGTQLVPNSRVALSGKETLQLANYELDLSSPEIQAKLKAMKSGDVINVGREVNGPNDIVINDPSNTVSRRHLIIEKSGDKYIVSDAGSLNGTRIGESLPPINENELVRNAGNGGKPINADYIRTSREARQYLQNAISSGKYTESLDSYMATMNDMHRVSANGKNGQSNWYNTVGNGELGVTPGVIRNDFGGLRNRRIDSAQEVEKIARKYGDPYRVNADSQVNLAGIDDKFLPMDGMGGYHYYPAGVSLKSYYKQMHRTANEALKLIDSGASEQKILKKLAEHYQYAANARPYSQINNSLFMNELNTLLTRAGMKTMPHGILDIASMHLQPETFQKYFIDQYNLTALK